MMNSLLAASLLAGVVAEQQHPVHAGIVERITARGAWQAIPVESNRFANYTIDEIKALMGLQMPENPAQSLPSDLQVGSFPDSFDGRQKFSSCQKPVRDQAHCGSCWAFGAAETLTTNLCVLGDGNPPLSAQELVSCDTADHGCKGGTLPGAWNFIDTHGLPSESCMPYTAGEGDVASCPPSCTNGGSPQRFKCPVAPTALNSDAEIQAALMTVGAVEVGMWVYEDFLNYKGGVYSYQEGVMLGGHAVKMVGWGKKMEQFYWIVQNSWGPSWGEDGFFRIANWHEDKKSGIAIAGGHACVDGPTPAPPSPAPAPTTCHDIATWCQEPNYGRSSCAAKSFIIPVCQKTCGCCGSSNKPSYCSADETVVV